MKKGSYSIFDLSQNSQLTGFRNLFRLIQSTLSICRGLVPNFADTKIQVLYIKWGRFYM